jgi:hypothetical protein
MVAATIYPTTQSDISNLADATISIVEQAFSLALRKQVLSHQEYKQLLDSIGWSLKESKLYLKVANAFSSFSPDHLQEVEPHTIFDLAKHAKKYSQVIESLKDCGKITQEKVHEFILAHRKPKPPKSNKPTIWKTGRDGEPVCRIPDIMEDDMQTGSIIQKEMDENGKIAQRVIREAVELWKAVQEGKLIVKDVEEDIESPPSANSKFEKEDFIDGEVSKSEANFNTNSVGYTQGYEDASQEHHNSDNIVSNEESIPKSTNLNTFQLDVSDNQTLSLDQIVETLTRVESWLEVTDIIDNYPQSTKSHIWGLLDNATQERFHELKRNHLENQDKPLQVNDKVMWEKCPGNIYSWQPFVITTIEDGKAMLDCFNRPVCLEELTKCKEN